MSAFNERTGNSGRNPWQVGRAPFALSTLQLAAARTVPLITAAHLTDDDAAFLADPFRIAVGDSVFVLAEAWSTTVERGRIAAFRLNGEGEVAEAAIVLAESFHLSYPCSFQYGGDYYMLPEAWESGRLMLYKARSFPWTWERHAVLLELDYADPQVFFHHGTWYLFLTTDPLTNARASLFWAQSPLGPWHEHPCNPIFDRNPLLARSAGPLVQHDGRIVRFSQDCRDAYGRGVFASEITALSRSTFDAVPLGAVELQRPAWALTGLHHLDVHFDGGRPFALFDGYTGVQPPAEQVDAEVAR